MRLLRQAIGSCLAAAYLVAFLSGIGCGGGTPEHEASGQQLFESPQADALVLSPDGETLYMAHTTMGQVRVLDTGSLSGPVIEVGTDPVSLALRPDGTELWVANHVSDSISVVSLTPGPTQYKVVDTIQAVDTGAQVTDFDEPIGIAFASNSKAYVALSSRDQIAVIDADTYTVTGFLSINAQEPRALVVRNGRLFVPAFESGNRSELSSCFGAPVPGDTQCTFDFTQANFAQNPQLVGFDVDIAADPEVPDRDLYVFDTSNDQLVGVVDAIGTLLYGVAVDSNGKVFISQTDARNLVNGRAGTQGQGLADLDNRMFLNQIGVVSCASLPCGTPSRFELEPLPPSQPTAGSQLATPYGIAISANNEVLIVTAASSSRVAAVDAVTGQVLDTIDVGNGPRAVALRSDPDTGAPLTAWVLNTLDSSVSELDLTGLDVQGQPPTLVETRRRTINDTTPAAIRSGRIAFNSAAASTTGTFSCGSCHPDGNVDQLLWVIGAQCTFSTSCDQEEARSTMPVRGLKGTLPLHWDGALGDSTSGVNGEVGANGTASGNCTDDQSCFRHLVNASLSGVMCDQAPGGCPTNDIGQLGGLSNAERDAMATYLQSVSYPPARTRRFDDTLTAQATAGFSEFFEDFDQSTPATCADNSADGSGCHALPLGAGTNSILVGGFDAPTMRGITDRYLQFSAGVTNVRDLLEVASNNGATDAPWSPAVGYDEFVVWALAFGSEAVPGVFRSVYDADPFDTFQMVEEASTGHSGALGRQVTLNLRTTSGGELAVTQSLLAALETADQRGVVNLNGHGMRNGSRIQLSFRSDGTYKSGSVSLTRAQLISEAAAGTTVLTLTGDQRGGVNASTLQPTIWVLSTGGITTGRPVLPVFNTGANPGLLSNFRARNILSGAQVLIDGVPVALDAPIACRTGGELPNCTSNNVAVDLAAPPATVGLHVMQIQNPGGLISNELPMRRN